MTRESTKARRPKRRAQLAALFEIGSAMLETMDADRILQLICDRALDLLGASGSVVTELDPGMGELVHLRGSGILEDTRGFRFPVRGSLNGAAIQRREPVIENDIESSPLAHIARQLPVRFSRGVTVPMICRGQVLGTLACVSGSDVAPFNDDDARLLMAFANSAALALDNARTYRSEQERRERHIERLVTLHQADLAVSADLRLEALLQRIVDEARRLTGARYGALGVLDDSGERLSKFVTSGITRREYRKIPELPTGKGLLGAVIREGRTIRVGSAPGDSRSEGVPHGHPTMSSFLGVPIRVRDRVFGNLYLTNKEGSAEFSEDDAEIVEMLAEQAGIAIENARLFAQRDQLIRELERTQRIRNRLQAYVHHDIRNALHGISLWAERLGRASESGAKPDDEVIEIGEKIGRGSRHALRLVNDVLDLTRLEEGRLQTWPRRVSVAELRTAAFDTVSPDADRRSIRLVAEESKPGLELVADPDRVLQVVVNLLGNAVKFSPEGSTVWFGAASGNEGPRGEEGQWITFRIRDEGPGIDPRDQERIFEGFEQLDAEARKKGTGIGLTLSRMLATYMGGALTLESSVGEGSTFSLWLPADVEPVQREGWIG